MASEITSAFARARAAKFIVLLGVVSLFASTRRGTRYGVFNTGYGIFWFAGSALMGYLYSISIVSVVVFSVAAELLSLPILAMVRRHGTDGTRAA